MKVEIDLTDTSGFSPSSGDHVVFEAKNLIGSATEPGRVISTAPVRVNLVSGKGTVTLEPGPHLLRVKARNYRDSAPIAFTVPEGQGSMTLRELLEGSFEYEPSVIQDAQAYTAQARSYAEEAATSAKIVGSAQSVLDAAESARGSAAAAAADKSAVAEDRRAVAADRALVEGVRDDAVASINEAASEASETALGTISAQTEVARGYRNEAESFKESASEFSSNAGAKAAEAAQSANEAASSAANASDSAAASESARASGESLLIEGRSLAEQGHADADRAVAARDQSEQYARSAGEKATAAEASAQAAAASAESAKQGAPEGGWTKSQLHVNVQAQLDKVDSLPTSQTVQSMIAGKADKSMVQEGLAGKLDAQSVSENVTNSTLVKRTSDGRIKAANGTAADDVATYSQLDNRVVKLSGGNFLYGRDASGEAAISYSDMPMRNTIAKRDGVGSVLVPEPTSSGHAANKSYVDSAVASSSSKYLLLAYANSSEMALPRTTAKAIPWVTESGTVTHQHTSGADGGVLIKEPGVYHITANFPYIDFYSDKVSYELQTAPPGGSYSTAKFTLMESSIAWDRSDSMSWPLTLASQMWIRLLVTCNSGTAGGWNRNKKIKADMLLTKIA